MTFTLFESWGNVNLILIWIPMLATEVKLVFFVFIGNLFYIILEISVHFMSRFIGCIVWSLSLSLFHSHSLSLYVCYVWFIYSYVYRCMWSFMCANARGHWMTWSITDFLIPLIPCLPLNLGASKTQWYWLQPHHALPCTRTGERGAQGCILYYWHFYVIAVIWFQNLMLAKQTLLSSV